MSRPDDALSRQWINSLADEGHTNDDITWNIGFTLIDDIMYGVNRRQLKHVVGIHQDLGNKEKIIIKTQK